LHLFSEYLTSSTAASFYHGNFEALVSLLVLLLIVSLSFVPVETMNLDLTQELEPDSAIDEAEFEFATPLPVWDDDTTKDDVPFDRSLNRYGVVYVRLLKAQR
jgi:hypothetical protein